MKFCLIIHCSSQQKSLSYHAYQFAQTVLKENNNINCIFFQYHGADHYLKDDNPNNINTKWQQLA